MSKTQAIGQIESAPALILPSETPRPVHRNWCKLVPLFGKRIYHFTQNFPSTHNKIRHFQCFSKKNSWQSNCSVMHLSTTLGDFGALDRPARREGTGMEIEHRSKNARGSMESTEISLTSFVAPSLPSGISVRRKVLIIENEPSISNLLYVLLEGLNYIGEVAPSGVQALAMIRRGSFDAILMDLRCSAVSAEQLVSRIMEIRPNLLGRVLVITGEVEDPKIMELIERKCLPHVSENRMMDDVHRNLRAMLELSPQT